MNHQQTNFTQTDFLNVTLNLRAKKNLRANNQTLYINIFSKHLQIIEQLSKMINKKIPDLSFNKEEFDKVKLANEAALKDDRHFLSMFLKTLLGFGIA